MELGRLGVWSIGIRQVANSAVPVAAAELEQLGYGTIWYSAGSGTRGFDIGLALVKATGSIAIATGITSIWATTLDQSAAGFEQMEQAAPGRFLLGLGVSHAPMVNQRTRAATAVRCRTWRATSASSPRSPETAASSPRSGRRCSIWPGESPSERTRIS